MMGTVDYLGRFLDVDIRHPESTSDYLVFATSDLKEKLETNGFLAEGLEILGDNAYCNSSYMVTPYKSATGSEDDFNFYQSQLRIQVECAFGKLVQRWGILRHLISCNIGLERISSLVMALCRLHNFCINLSHETVPSSLAQDEVQITINSHFELSVNPDNHVSQKHILHGGDHFDDIGQFQQRAIRRHEKDNEHVSPRNAQHKLVQDKGLCGPSTM